MDAKLNKFQAQTFRRGEEKKRILTFQSYQEPQNSTNRNILLKHPFLQCDLFYSNRLIQTRDENESTYPTSAFLWDFCSMTDKMDPQEALA